MTATELNRAIAELRTGGAINGETNYLTDANAALKLFNELPFACLKHDAVYSRVSWRDNQNFRQYTGDCDSICQAICLAWYEVKTAVRVELIGGNEGAKPIARR